MFRGKAEQDARSDEQLYRLTLTGDRSAEEALITRYSGLVRACAHPISLVGGDGEDLIQEGMLGLLSAIRTYDPDGDASFPTYAEVCIRNRIFSVLRAAGRKKNAPLNYSCSLDAVGFDADELATDPESMMIGKERVQALLHGVRQKLSPLEKDVFAYYLQGMTCSEIAKTTGRSFKTVDNAINRIRRKAAKQISFGDLSES